MLELIGPMAIALQFGWSRSRVVRLDGVDCRRSSFVLVIGALLGAWWFGGERKALDVDRWLAPCARVRSARPGLQLRDAFSMDLLGFLWEEERSRRLNMVPYMKARGIERDLFFMISTWKYHLHLLIY